MELLDTSSGKGFDQAFDQDNVAKEDSADNDRPITLDPAEAVVAIMFAAVASDGYLAEEETSSVWNSLSRMQLFKGYSYEVVKQMFGKLSEILHYHGLEALLLLAKAALPSELAPTVFTIAADLVLSDGLVMKEEEALLERLYRLLEIPKETAMQIVRVMVIKNRG